MGVCVCVFSFCLAFSFVFFRTKKKKKKRARRRWRDERPHVSSFFLLCASFLFIFVRRSGERVISFSQGFSVAALSLSLSLSLSLFQGERPVYDPKAPREE